MYTYMYMYHCVYACVCVHPHTIKILESFGSGHLSFIVCAGFYIEEDKGDIPLSCPPKFLAGHIILNNCVCTWV